LIEIVGSLIATVWSIEPQDVERARALAAAFAA
jgi:hypothetical protein